MPKNPKSNPESDRRNASPQGAPPYVPNDGRKFGYKPKKPDSRPVVSMTPTPPPSGQRPQSPRRPTAPPAHSDDDGDAS